MAARVACSASVAPSRLATSVRNGICARATIAAAPLLHQGTPAPRRSAAAAAAGRRCVVTAANAQQQTMTQVGHACFCCTTSSDIACWPGVYCPRLVSCDLLIKPATTSTCSLQPFTIVGGGRVGAALAAMGGGADAVVRRGEPVSRGLAQGPIVVCTRNDDLQAVVDATPPERRKGARRQGC